MSGPERNLALAIAVVRDGRRKYLIAADAHVPPASFSAILSGRLRPTPATQERIAKALGVPVEEIFPELVSA